MINKTDSLKAGLQPLLAKTLENALAHRIEKEFPRIGGQRICRLCAEMIMVRGHAGEIRHLADHLRQQKGVFHAGLSMSTTGTNLA